MICGFLLGSGDIYQAALFDGQGVLPPVPCIQEWLEKAWHAGFDAAGAEQLEGRIAHSKKYIGAMECAALLRFFGVRAHVCSFSSPVVPPTELDRRRQQAALDAHHAYMSRKKPRQPQYVPSHEPCTALGDFCWKYFLGRQPGVLGDVEPFCPPLYLQHEGHSRTIVGADRSGTSINVLLFDPSVDSNALLADVRDHKRLRKLRRSAQTFTQPRYEVCLVAPGIADAGERELLKTIVELSPEQALEIPLISDS